MTRKLRRRLRCQFVRLSQAILPPSPEQRARELSRREVRLLAWLDFVIGLGEQPTLGAAEKATGWEDDEVAEAWDALACAGAVVPDSQHESGWWVTPLGKRALAAGGKAA